jgi:hypothetical protein
MKQIADKLVDESTGPGGDKAMMERLIKEAKEAIEKGKSLDEFKTE